MATEQTIPGEAEAYLKAARHPLWCLTPRRTAQPVLPLFVFWGVLLLLAIWARYMPTSLLFDPMLTAGLIPLVHVMGAGLAAMQIWVMWPALSLMRFSRERPATVFWAWGMLLLSPVFAYGIGSSALFRAAPLLSTYVWSQPIQVERAYAAVQAGSTCLMDSYRCHGRTSEYHKYLDIPGHPDLFSRIILPDTSYPGPPKRYEAPLPQVVIIGRGNLFGLRVETIEWRGVAAIPDG